jgi:penicillin-insensitive murein endopeptidase
MRWKWHAAAVLFALVLMTGAAIAMPGPEDGARNARPALAARTVTPAADEPPAPEPTVEEDATPPGPTPSVSVGRANRGRLIDGVRLEESDRVRFKNGSPEHTRFGTVELVGMLERGALHVSRVLPGAKLTVGDLSRRGGGWLRPHRSHRSGRDVDIAFYAVDAEDVPLEPITLVPYRADGTGRGTHGEGTVFDADRNWELVAAMLEDPQASVQYIFVSRRLRSVLLEAGERRNASPELLERASIALEQPRRGGRHDDHFHVRIYCPEDDLPRCRDTPPWRPWYSGER